jgi:leader peptidase (prepilin peptidase)/N-methyltransferase
MTGYIAISVLLGLCIGSFLNVVIFRWPKQPGFLDSLKALWWPPSHCACGTPLKWYHNIPLLSWAVLRGKSACCHQPISVRYPLVEALTGAVFAVIAWRELPDLPATLIFQGCAAALIVAFFVDLDLMEIPDTVTIGGSLLVVLLRLLFPEAFPVGWADAAWGFLLGTSIIAWVNFFSSIFLNREGMGWGDAKLLALLGLLMGWRAVAFGFFGGAILGVLWVLFQRYVQSRSNALQKGREIPFGPAIIAAAFIYFLGGWKLVEMYLNIL